MAQAGGGHGVQFVAEAEISRPRRGGDVFRPTTSRILSSPTMLRIVLVAVAYFACGQASLALALVGDQIAPVWLPAGVAVAAMLVWGKSVWPGVAVGALIVNLPVSTAPAVAVGIATGNTAAVVASAYLLERIGFRAQLDRLKDAAALILVAAHAGTTISATVGTLTLLSAGVVGGEGFWSAWQVWWTGDAIGIMVVTPLLLALARSDDALSRMRIAESCAMLLFTAVVAYATFSSALEVQFLIFPFLGWAAWRFRVREAGAAMLVASLFAVVAAVRGIGPFQRESLFEEMVSLHIFCVSAAFASVVLATLVQERARIRAQLQHFAESVREESIQELARSNQELEQFAHVAAHDLQEPLRTIRGFVRLIEARVAAEEDEDVKSLIERIDSGTERLSELVNSQLEYARAGASPPSPTTISLEGSVRRVMDDLASVIAKTGARFEIHPLPYVQADPTQIAQLLQNLIGNALKFRRSDTPCEIRIRARSVGDMCEVCVADNGIGLKSRFAESIFEPFRRLHGRDQYPGTGMGLAICKKIVERHNGQIWVEADRPVGSAFFFTLPLAAQTVELKDR
ncbi:MAG TPA: MASE1 domain-containing protein [Actinomycetota bacterium]|nr:MASE1 domain-containing protein [Actinomycetota bacterium]